jgi:CDP-diacylglycerol--glycerol-3-phosphate 3-phosphatidyltransferase
MMIRANQLTFLRMILLPIPCYLVFQGMTEKVIALLLCIILGLTDYFDGYLARKQGPTVLGTMMDPIADKIFITAIYIPLAKMEIVPIWMILLLFVREYTITELRSIYASSGILFKTSEFAKYKTTIQMAGGGFIFIIKIFGESLNVLIVLGGCFLLAALPGAISLIRSRRMGTRSIAAFVLVGAAFCLRLFLPPQEAIWAIMVVIVAVTLASGIQYITRSWTHLRQFLIRKFEARQWAYFIGIALVFPSLYVFLAKFSVLAAWIVILILSIEFAIGGLNNLLTELRIRKDYIASPRKTLFQVLIGIVAFILVLAALPEFRPIVRLVMLVGLAATLVHSIRHFYVHRAHFLPT